MLSPRQTNSTFTFSVLLTACRRCCSMVSLKHQGLTTHPGFVCNPPTCWAVDMSSADLRGLARPGRFLRERASHNDVVRVQLTFRIFSCLRAQKGGPSGGAMAALATFQ